MLASVRLAAPSVFFEHHGRTTFIIIVICVEHEMHEIIHVDKHECCFHVLMTMTGRRRENVVVVFEMRLV